MGNCACTDGKNDSSLAVNISDFELKHPIGRGGFGRVWKVYHKKTNALYAMKEMRKDLIVSKRSAPSIMNERRLLGILKHPFIVNLHFAFQNSTNLFLVIDMMAGGDLRYYMIKNPEFDETRLKFLAASILAGLEYLHTNNIIHRDIKPENLVFDSKGYLHLTDFGIARMSTTDNSAFTSGTPGYMAPEVLFSQNHGIAVDYFALGVVLYECVTHSRPYAGKTRKEIREVVLEKQVKLNLDDNTDWSKNLVEFINKLIQRKPEQRLGFHGIEEVKEHNFFSGFEWDRFLRKEIDSPFKFEDENNFDFDHVMSSWEQPTEKISALNSQKLFAGFLYDEIMFGFKKEGSG